MSGSRRFRCLQPKEFPQVCCWPATCSLLSNHPFRDRKIKSASVAGFGFHPNPAPMPLDDTAANCQSNARSRMLPLTMQPLEYLENSLVMFRGDANTVVPHGENPVVARMLGADVNAWRVFAVVFEAVPKQVLHQLLQLRTVAHYHRQFVTSDLAMHVSDGCLQRDDCIVENFTERNPPERLGLRVHARVCQHVPNQLLHSYGRLDRAPNPVTGLLVQCVSIFQLDQLDEAAD